MKKGIINFFKVIHEAISTKGMPGDRPKRVKKKQFNQGNERLK